MVVDQGSALPILPFPKALRQLFHPPPCFPSCPGPKYEPRGAKAQFLPLQDKLLEQPRVYHCCLPPRRVLLTEANTYAETTNLKRKTKLCVDSN